MPKAASAVLSASGAEGDPKMLCPGECYSGPTARQRGEGEAVLGAPLHTLQVPKNLTFFVRLSHPLSGVCVPLVVW